MKKTLLIIVGVILLAGILGDVSDVLSGTMSLSGLVYDHRVILAIVGVYILYEYVVPKKS